MVAMEALRVDARTIIPVDLLSWSAVRASGAGGQNVNKVASKVELRFDLAACTTLRPDVKARLSALTVHRRAADGRVRIVSQATRDQLKNLEDAREKLADLIRTASIPEIPRRPTKPTRASKRRRVEGKQRQAQKKQLRGRVRSDE
jgi:ribosome-associated protein